MMLLFLHGLNLKVRPFIISGSHIIEQGRRLLTVPGSENRAVGLYVKETSNLIQGGKLCQ